MKNLFLAAVLLTFIGCNNTTTEEQDASMETEHHDKMASETSSDTNVVSDQDLEKFKTVSADVAGQLLDAYLEIKDALVQTNGAEAKKAAEAIQADISAADEKALSLIKEDIQQIASTESVEHQREHFDALSKHMYAMVKATGAKDGKLYRQYCPMAFDNAGAFWLSSSEEIRNPYFGDKMLKCGKVQETIGE